MVTPTTPATSTVANADSASGPLPPPIPWPIFGNTYVNTKTSRNGWSSVRGRNSLSCLRSTVRSRRSKALNAAQLAVTVLRRAVLRPPGAASGVVVVVAISRAAPSP
jgi:hypothetical protein